VIRFIVVLEAPTRSQQTAVSQLLTSLGAGWGHFLPSLWFVEFEDDDITATKLTNRIHKALPETAVVVLGIDATTEWSGRGDPDMFKWLRANEW